MMMNNPGVMGQQVPPPNAGQQPPQGQQTTVQPQMMSSGMNTQMNLQARQNQNDEILARCLNHTQRLRENLQALLNITKQAAHIENDEQTSSANLSTNTTLRNNIDRKLYDMSASLDQIFVSLDQYDYKALQNQQVLVNHYNELSYEKQGFLLDEWATNVKWADKIAEISASLQPRNQLYRRSNNRNVNPNIRSRIDGPSSTLLDRIITQFEAMQAQQQQSLPKEYSLSLQRLSDHLHVIEFCLFRSGLDIYLFVRHCTIEHIVVKPLNEKKFFSNNLNNKFSSNYRALELIAGHMRAAAVYHAQVSPQADQSLLKLLIYISKYQGLNSVKCAGCQKHLLNGLLPTWRDFKTYEAFHEECLN